MLDTSFSRLLVSQHQKRGWWVPSFWPLFIPFGSPRYESGAGAPPRSKARGNWITDRGGDGRGRRLPFSICRWVFFFFPEKNIVRFRTFIFNCDLLKGRCFGSTGNLGFRLQEVSHSHMQGRKLIFFFVFSSVGFTGNQVHCWEYFSFFPRGRESKFGHGSGLVISIRYRQANQFHRCGLFQGHLLLREGAQGSEPVSSFPILETSP